MLNFILSRPWNDAIKVTPRAKKGLESFVDIISDFDWKNKKIKPRNNDSGNIRQDKVPRLP